MLHFQFHSFFQGPENYMEKLYSLFWCCILAWRSCHFGRLEIHLKNLLSPTPQPSRQTCCYIKERYTYDNAFPRWWGITEDIVTMKSRELWKQRVPWQLYMAWISLCWRKSSSFQDVQLPVSSVLDSWQSPHLPKKSHFSPCNWLYNSHYRVGLINQDLCMFSSGGLTWQALI